MKSQNLLSRQSLIKLWSDFIQRHYTLLILTIIAVGNLLIFTPAITAYFISDDFSYVSYLIRNAKSLLDGKLWDVWFFAGIDGYLYFRPFGHLLMLIDFVIGNQTPWVFHLTNILAHILASFEVYLLGFLITRRRTQATVAALLFAVMSIHADAVSWIAARYDVLAGLWFMASLIFFILYRQRRSLKFYLASLGTLGLSLASKETALAFPLILLLYDLLFTSDWRKDWQWAIARHLPFWLAVGIRLVLFGHGYQGLQISSENIWHWIDGNLVNLLDPLSIDMTSILRWFMLGLLALLLYVCRSRREMIFGILWIPLTSLPTILSGPSDRSFYIPSVGLTVVLAGILATQWNQKHRTFKMGSLAVFALLMMGYGLTLFERNQDVYRAGEIAEAIPTQVLAMHPTLPKGSRLVFVGVPDQTPQGTLVYLTGFPGLLPFLYPDVSPQIFRSNKFPVLMDPLDRTLFFQVDHRRVIERTDLIDALRQRQACGDAQYPALAWNFSNGTQAWETWNQLANFDSRDSGWYMESTGTDPNLASPVLDIPSMAIGDIEITMRVQATRGSLNGALYWLATGQDDFSPGLQVKFPVQADDQFHVYRLDIAKSGGLNIEDHILRLRLNPVDDLAAIELNSIRIFLHCSELQHNQCNCPPESKP